MAIYFYSPPPISYWQLTGTIIIVSILLWLGYYDWKTLAFPAVGLVVLAAAVVAVIAGENRLFPPAHQVIQIGDPALRWLVSPKNIYLSHLLGAAIGAAIASAIDNAIGQPGAVTRLPVTPARLHALLKACR